MEEILKTLEANYIEILSVNLSFIGVVIAVFFTLIVLPIQSVLGRYSQDFVNKIARNWFFLFSFSFLALIFIYDLILLIIPRNILLISVALFLGIFSIVLLGILINFVFRKLDIRNQLIGITENIIHLIPSKFKKYENKMPYKFSAPEGFIEWLKEKTEIIFDVVQKAVQENRFEIVEAGLYNVGKIMANYVDIRKEYKNENDNFNFFILERLKDTKNMVIKTTHPKVMNSIVNICGSIAIKLLDLKPLRYQFGENFMPLGYCNLLKNIILSGEIIKETSYAPANACENLLLIGKAAINTKYAKTTNAIARDLSETSRHATGLHFFYGDWISGKANACLSNLLEYTIVNLDNSICNREYVLKSISGEINKVIGNYFKDDYEDSMRSNIQPFISLVADYNIAITFGYPLIKFKKEEDWGEPLQLDTLLTKSS